MKLEHYGRRPFDVEAVQVTRDNMEEVAAWCGGEIKTKESKTRTGTKTETYIEVPVQRPINEKQKQAFVTDWVLKSPKGLKVYTNKAFVATFESREAPVGNVFEHSPEIVEAKNEASEPAPVEEPGTMEKLGFPSESKKVEL